MKSKSQNIGFAILIILGIIIALSPVDQMASKPVDLKTVVSKLAQTNYVQPDEVAGWIIDKEPGFIVVDVRSQDDYAKYSIPGSINIPITDILGDEMLQDIEKDKTVVLVSNGNTKASQAWILLKQLGYKDVYVLQGGMNRWVAVFSNPPKPGINYTDDELFTYQFRVAAGPVMIGKAVAAQPENVSRPVVKKTPVKRIRKKKKKKIDEGC